MSNKDHLSIMFKKTFNVEATGFFFSPGRVNLIGEHIDYHGGLVFPAALTIGTYGAISKRDDNIISVFSEGYGEEIVSFTMLQLEKDKKTSWANYIRGVFWVLKSEGIQVPSGVNIYIYSDMPTSAGLSSSSSLELLVFKMLSDTFNLGLSKLDIALFGKKVENEYIGLQSGIMDQFIIAHGEKDHALLLNTGTLTYKSYPVNLKDYSLVIVNTNKRRGLTDSKYNERFNETMTALKILQAYFNIKYLVDLKTSDLPKISKILGPLTYRRVRHVITEQERTLKSAEALQKGDIFAFSEYLNGSHNSLRDDYEVTGKELDTLVTLLRKGGALGARMTGAGFGGCAIGIVPKGKIESLTTFVIEEYTKKIGYAPTFFSSEISEGTHAL